jgi:hypothetical protein
MLYDSSRNENVDYKANVRKSVNAYGGQKKVVKKTLKRNLSIGPVANSGNRVTGNSEDNLDNTA